MRRKIQRMPLTSGDIAKELGVDLETGARIHDTLLVRGRAAYGSWEMHVTVSGNHVDLRHRPTARRLPAPNKPW